MDHPPLVLGVLRAIGGPEPRFVADCPGERGAATRALQVAQRGLAGAFEDDPCLDRAGYRKIIALLQAIGVPE